MSSIYCFLSDNSQIHTATNRPMTFEAYFELLRQQHFLLKTCTLNYKTLFRYLYFEYEIYTHIYIPILSCSIIIFIEDCQLMVIVNRKILVRVIKISKNKFCHQIPCITVLQYTINLICPFGWDSIPKKKNIVWIPKNVFFLWLER